MADSGSPPGLDTAGLAASRRELAEMNRLAAGFGAAMGRAFDGLVVKGRGFDDVLRTLALNLSKVALSAAFRPLEQGLGSMLSSLLGGVTQSGVAASLPNVFTGDGALAAPGFLASGNVADLVSAPLAVAAAPAVAMPAAGAAGSPLAVTFNVATPDVEGFKRSESQLAAMLARTVGRSNRVL